MNAAVPTSTSYEDYLTLEETSEIKHEWWDGAVFAMSRGTPEHARLIFNVGASLGRALRGTCTGYASDAMLFIEPVSLSTYADASFVCGAVETKTVIKNGVSLGVAITNPTIIVEVLSDSTERYDRDGKFRAYKTLPSFQEYVLVSQHEPSVEVYRRDASGRWSIETAKAGGRVTVHGVVVTVDDLYA